MYKSSYLAFLSYWFRNSVQEVPEEVVMETDTAIVEAATVVEIESEIQALAAQTMPMTGDVLLLPPHAMTEAALVAIDSGKGY
jgi:hypothetical protein